jgi:hypothetical protein
LASVEDVADWMSNAVLLPQYAEAFQHNSVTGYDLAGLVQDHGRMLSESLGVSNPLHRKKIMRAIRMRLVGVAKGWHCVR